VTPRARVMNALRGAALFIEYASEDAHELRDRELQHRLDLQRHELLELHRRLLDLPLPREPQRKRRK